MRVLVTGRFGQVAEALAEVGPSLGAEIVRVGRPDLEFTRPETILPVVRAIRPDAIISVAAYTAVDAAEGDPAAAFAVNAAAVGELGEAAAQIGVPVVHLSTDYVFDGRKQGAYLETDRTGPLGVYGQSKLEGERLLQAAQPWSAVLRTSWVFSPFGRNFVRTMLRLGEQNGTVRVVADQIGAPTSAHDIARASLIVAANLRNAPGEADRAGVFHFTSREATSWAGFAEAVFLGASRRGRPLPAVVPITTADFPTAARRPANSRLDCRRIAAIHGIGQPDWRQALDTVLDRLLQEPAIGLRETLP